jgi:hypothetical protein
VRLLAVHILTVGAVVQMFMGKEAGCALLAVAAMCVSMSKRALQ